jgi:hypothetical protein
MFPGNNKNFNLSIESFERRRFVKGGKTFFSIRLIRKLKGEISPLKI